MKQKTNLMKENNVKCKERTAKPPVYIEEHTQRNDEIRAYLQEMAEPTYQQFSSKLLPSVNNIMGVRLPKLRMLAKQLAKGDFKSYLEYALDDSFEEIMLQGMTIGYVKQPLEVMIAYIERFVTKIDNWSVCDSFCSGLKIAKKEPEAMWNFIQKYVYSNREYEVRFAVVMMLNYYVDEEHIQEALEIFERITHEGYYVKMAVAWAISIYFIKFCDKVYEYLQKSKLDTFTYNKALQKICESRVISASMKEKVRFLHKN